MVTRLLIVVGLILAALFVLDQCGLFRDDPPDDEAPGGTI